MHQLLYGGIDWATKTHAVGAINDQGGIRARFHVPNTGKGFGGLIRHATQVLRALSRTRKDLQKESHGLSLR